MVPAAASASQETRKRPSTFIVQYALPTQKWPDGSFGAFLLRHGERGRASVTRPLIASSLFFFFSQKKKIFTASGRRPAGGARGAGGRAGPGAAAGRGER